MVSKVSYSPPSESRDQVNRKWIVRSLAKLSSTSAGRERSMEATRAYRSVDVQSGVSKRSLEATLCCFVSIADGENCLVVDKEEYCCGTRESRDISNDISNDARPRESRKIGS